MATKNNTKPNRNIIAIVDAPFTLALPTIDETKKVLKGSRYLLIYNKKFIGKEKPEVIEAFDFMVPCDFESPDSIMKALLPYRKEIKTVHCRAEVGIPNFQKVIPHLPYVRTPSTESLEWAIDKFKMRNRFQSFNKDITPKFKFVKDTSKSTIDMIEKKIGFPLVIKPIGLAQSLLVTNVYHREELQKSLSSVFKKIKKVYKEAGRNAEPGVLVEQFIEGNMYSIDGYISSRGGIVFCPMVQIKTGKEIGFDDFFGYQQMTPTTLTKNSTLNAEDVAGQGVKALGLRSTAFHAELIKNDSGWKVIEIGPRIGGFRADLYEYSFGINHRANSVLIGIPHKLTVPKRVLAHSAALKIFSKKEGTIKSITGVKKIKELKSVKNVSQNLKPGDKATFAAKGGKSVVNIILSNKERSKLLADIRRIEKLLVIKV